jgi:hypothetical protein
LNANALAALLWAAGSIYLIAVEFDIPMAVLVLPPRDRVADDRARASRPRPRRRRADKKPSGTDDSGMA